MIVADMNKWISGETQSFFDPHSTPSGAASVDSKSADEKLTVRAAIRKSVPLAIAGVFGAFACVALVYFVGLTRAPIESSRAADQKSQSTGGAVLVTGGRLLREVEGSRLVATSPPEIIPAPAMPILNQPITAPPDVRLAPPRPERKAAPTLPVLRRDRPRYSVSDQAEREETTRLMRDQLRQRGVDADAVSGSDHPE